MASKISIEGEGIRLGLKTHFFQYPEMDLTVVPQINNIYINAFSLDTDLYEYCKNLAVNHNKYITIETEQENVLKYLELPNLLVFLVASEFKEGIAVNDRLFIKVRVVDRDALAESIDIANKFAHKHFRNVLLMPEFDCNIAKLLVKYSGVVSDGVRFMPPVQNLIGIL